MAIGITDTAGLYRSERGRLMRLLRTMVRNDAVAEDLVQDSFVGLIARGANADHPAAYLRRIANNLALDHLRRQRHQAISLDDVDLFACADPAPSAETVLIDRQALDTTFAALSLLPARTREAFVLHRLGELTLAKIASRLGISTAHAGRLVMQGYLAVRDGLRVLDEA